MTLWDRILSSLQRKMNSQSFNTWLRPTQQLSVADGALQIEVPSAVFADFIHKNYLPLIEESARELAIADLRLNFTSRDHDTPRRPAPPPARDVGRDVGRDLSRDTTRDVVRDTARDTARDTGHGSGRETGREATRAGATAPVVPGAARWPVMTVSEAPAAPRPAGPSATPAHGTFSAITSRYTFDSFVVSSCNQFAHAAALAVAEQPSSAYNPLYVYGGVGLGKTHLMHAVGNQIGRLFPGMRRLYISAETFMNELINAIRFEKTLDFKDRYRSVDVLLIDDIQFLAGKERTQEEFFHTFNALYESQKQIVITSDCPPREIPTLEERLRSRFEWGLIADIQPPDLETKVAILRKKAEAENLPLPEDVALFIASRVRSNIRELEGSLIRLIAFSSLSGRTIDIEMAKETLRDLIDDRGRSITVESIQRLIAAHYRIKVTELKSRNNSKHISFPRQVAMYVAKQLTDKSLPALGEYFGGKHHTTVIHAIRKIEAMRQRDREFDSLVAGFLESFK